MIFIVVSTVSLLIWLVFGQRKLLSVSFINLLATLMFIVLGLQLNPYQDIGMTVLIGIGFYFFLVVGECFARRIPISKEHFSRFGRMLTLNKNYSSIFTILFVVISIMPVLIILTSGQSIGDLFTATWATNTTAATSEKLLALTSHSATGLEALLKGVQTQFQGFWYLSVGIVLTRKSRWFYPVLAVYIFGALLSSGGFRSMLMFYLLLPVLLILPPSLKIPRFRTIILIGLLLIGMLLALDWLRYGRQGDVAGGTIQERIERTLRTDFAYGGLGLNLGLNNLPDSLDLGINYLARTVILPIPRVLWPGKPTSNPNQELTERATGKSYADYGNILLFTPLGEALFYFGYIGIIVIPLLYGFLTALLERLYSTSSAYRGLLVQVYLWSFLSMRLTFFNLFSSLIAANFILICMLLFGSILSRSRRLPSFGYAQND